MKISKIVIDRGFNGEILAPNINPGFFDYICINDYQEFLDRLIDKKLIKIIPHNLRPYWSEWYLSKWFYKNYKVFGFEDIAIEHTSKYKNIKKELKFNLRPDYLVLDNGEWLRVEVENWVHKYYYCHPEDYADIIVSYDNIKKYDCIHENPKKIFLMKDYFNVRYLLHKGELPYFLFNNNQSYRKKIKTLQLRYMAFSMGIEKIPT